VIRESEDVVGTILDIIRQENIRGIIGRVSPGIVRRLQEAKRI
jgi:hypothetical protein